MFVPIEAVVSNDSTTYVFRKDGSRIIKQQVIAGESNDNEIIIRTGVNENDEVLLMPPENADKIKLTELPPMELKKSEVNTANKKILKPDVKSTSKVIKPGSSR